MPTTVDENHELYLLQMKNSFTRYTKADMYNESYSPKPPYFGIALAEKTTLVIPYNMIHADHLETNGTNYCTLCSEPQHETAQKVYKIYQSLKKDQEEFTNVIVDPAIICIVCEQNIKEAIEEYTEKYSGTITSNML